MNKEESHPSHESQQPVANQLEHEVENLRKENSRLEKALDEETMKHSVARNRCEAYRILALEMALELSVLCPDRIHKDQVAELETGSPTNLPTGHRSEEPKQEA